MNKKLMIAGSITAVSFLMVAPALAQVGPQGPGGMPMRIWGHRAEQKGEVQERVEARENVNDDQGGIMGRVQQFMGQGILKGKGEMVGRAIGGKVSAVSGSSFSLEVPRMRDNATTTLTVNTTASTTFMLGKNPASLSDVAVGNFAMVFGPVSTSTQTITAVRVNLATSTPGIGPKPMMGKDGEGREWGVGASTTPEQVQADIAARMTEQFSGRAEPSLIRNIVNSVFSNFRHFFGR
ncbi:MAG: hypothetical protein WC050_02855 [Candidatus Paceibacterota bacterium]